MSTAWINPFEYEILEERAETLGVTGNRLEKTLHDLRRHESDPGTRDELVWQATELVTSIIVQREACGLRDQSFLYSHYGVPAEVIARIGVRRCA